MDGVASIARSVAAQDLYAYLDARPSWTHAELKHAFRTRILDLHPDRQPPHASAPPASTSTSSVVGVSEVTLAWEVLGDPATRREYDRQRALYLASKRADSAAFAHSVSLDHFTRHYPDGPEHQPQDTDDDDDDDDREPEYYTYPCRCSSQFKIATHELELGVTVVGCEGCSERCKVEYDVIEDE
ncbi:hypothetical protein JCM11491_003730 [Sporobolomyces phaffii]